jgi:cytochrome P450
MCIGKRFAELEMLIVVHKLMTNFEIKWANKEPLTISQVLLNVPDQSLKFQFKDLNI